MSIRMRCPTCGAANNLDDGQEGKTVRCSKCEEKFTVKPQRPRKKADDEDERPRRSCSRVADEDEDERPRRRRSRDDDEEDDRPRRRPAKKSSGGGVVLAVVGSIVALLLLVCGGGGLWFYFAVKNAVDEAQAQMQGGHAPAPGPFGGAPVAPPPPVPPPPQKPQPGLQITNVDEALEALKQKDRWRQDNGLRWLADAPPELGRREEVIAALEPIVRERKGSFTDLDINVLARWGGKESIPALIEALHVAAGQPLFPADLVRTQAAIRALGTLKDPKAAPALVADWYVGGDQDTAWALRAIGLDARKDVLPAIDHPNDQVRAAARGVILSYNTPADVTTAQALTDLGDKDWVRRGAAASWLAEARPTDADRAKVVKALDGMLADALAQNDPNFAGNVGNGKTLQWPAQQAAKAMFKWAGKDDLVALGRVVKLPPQVSGDGIYEALAATGDEKAVALLVERVRRGGNAVLAGQAIKGMGATGEAGMRKAMDDPDPEVQRVMPQLFLMSGMKDYRVAKALSDLKSEDKARRVAGATQLTHTPVDDSRREEVSAVLRPLIDAEDAALKNVVRDAFVLWAAKDDLPALIKLLGAEGRTQRQRMELIVALGETKDPRAIEALVPLVGGPESLNAERALIRSGAEAEKPVRKLLDSTDLKVRTGATRVLRGLGVKDNFEFETAWSDARSDDARRRTTGLILLGNSVTVPEDKKADLLKLAERLKDDADLGTRQQAINVLAKYATKDQVPVLLKLMEGKADGQRANVIVALGRLKEEKAAPLIVKCLGEPTEHAVAVKALTDIGSASEKPLLEELKSSKKDFTRISCVRVLEKVGTKESISALVDILNDPGTARNRPLELEVRKAIDAIKKRE
jgi:HEAT repeat protein